MRLHEFITKRISVVVVLTDGNVFLAVKPTNINYWECPKGQIDSGESTDNAAVREFKEETNITINKSKLEPVGMFPFHSSKKIFVYIYRMDTLPSVSSMRCDSMTSAYGDPVPEVESYRYVKLKDYRKLRYEMHAAMEKVVEVIQDETI